MESRKQKRPAQNKRTHSGSASATIYTPPDMKAMYVLWLCGSI